MKTETYWTLCPKCGYTDHVVGSRYVYCGKCKRNNYRSDGAGKPIYRLYRWQQEEWEKNEQVLRSCSYPGCDGEFEAECENCETWFCEDHGTPGGDRQVQDVGAVAYPSVCWKCGGHNEDA